MQIFQNKYCAESLCDIDRDVSEAFEADMNPIIKRIPMDFDNYYMKGEFTLTITWEDDNA